jgi:hypothetical protein
VTWSNIRHGYPAQVSQKRPLTSKGAKKLGERERTVGLDPEDEATRWLAEHDPPPAPEGPKAASKSKVLHQWRQRRQRGD